VPQETNEKRGEECLVVVMSMICVYIMFTGNSLVEGAVSENGSSSDININCNKYTTTTDNTIEGEGGGWGPQNHPYLVHPGAVQSV
jgi:hypothetical protein